jgi:hypothetical protein
MDNSKADFEAVWLLVKTHHERCGLTSLGLENLKKTA